MTHNPSASGPEHQTEAGFDSEAKSLAVPSQPIAPWPHTFAVVAILSLAGTGGYLRAHTATQGSDYLLVSLSNISSKVMLTGAVIAGIYHRQNFFRSILLNSTITWPRSFSRGIAVYLAGLIMILTVNLTARHLFHIPPPDRALLQSMLPVSFGHLFLWLFIATSAGLGEEIIFRGYLLQQVSAWLNPTWAILLTSIFFGLLHIYQGWISVLSLSLLGLLYALVVHRTGSIRIPVIAHITQDVLSASVFYLRHHQ